MKIMLCSVCFTVIMMLMVTNLKIANAQNGPFWDNLMAKYWADSRVKQLILVQHIGGSDAKVKFYVKSQENPLSLIACVPVRITLRAASSGLIPSAIHATAR